MKIKSKQMKKKVQNIFKNGYPLTIIFSITALVITFAVSNSAYDFELKLLIFLLIIAFYVLIQIGINRFFKQEISQPASNRENPSESGIFSSDVEEKLLILEEANNFFGASLKSADMFRLVASRISRLVEYDTCALFLLNEQNKLECKYAVGINSRIFDQIEMDFSEGLAGKAFQSKEIETDSALETERKYLAKEVLENLASAVAVPLLRGVEVYGVLNLYSVKDSFFDKNRKILLEAVGERVAPLINSSLMFERSLTNALTDSLTNLPNERAFYMVLENQIAEAQRSPEHRDLTILAIDIKSFAELNNKYGHPTGDKILTFTAELVKKQLRKMDFLARSQNDEFLVVLPTASDKITKNIIDRIGKSFETESFVFNETKTDRIKLNFGSATFYKDGETAIELVNSAIIRKRDDKVIQSGSVLRFPREYLN